MLEAYYLQAMKIVHHYTKRFTNRRASVRRTLMQLVVSGNEVGRESLEVGSHTPSRNYSRLS